MPRRMRVPPCPALSFQNAATRRFLVRLFLIAAFGLTAAVAPAPAQPPPPDVRPLPVTVATERPVYAPGESVRIRIKIMNPTSVPQMLHFPTTLQADYVIDGAWRWSAGKLFPQMPTSITVPPGESFTFPEFTHTPADYYLTPGRHTITAEVGYGQATTTIAVGDSVPPPAAPYMLSPSISPNPAPFGTPIALGMRVTNVSNQTLSFGHDGCPVHFTIDRAWKPQYLCQEYWHIETLQPGQSIEFTAADYPYLVVQNTPDFTLAPGWHSIEFEVPGVGVTDARFEVAGDAQAGWIAGHVYDPAGAPLQGAIVEAYPFGPIDSTGTPAADFPPPWTGYQAITDAEGLYVMQGLPAGPWVLRAYHVNSGEVWYNGAATREDADPVTVIAGATTAGIDFVLSQGPPPPPQYDAIITGRVVDDPWPLRRMSIPLPQAIVAAIPFNSGGVDSGWVPPGDSIDVTPRDAGPEPPNYPPTRAPRIFYGFPDSTGLYTIHLPMGVYKVIATAPGFHYQWWRRAADFDSAADVTAHALWMDSLPPMIDFALRPVPPDSMYAGIAGVVKGGSAVIGPMCPTCNPDGDFHPLAGAHVVARPLIVDPRIMTLVAEMYPAETGADGSYLIKVPVKSPYIVEASAENYGIQWYDHAFDPAAAKPVDVTSGQTTSGVNFDLFQFGPPPPPRGVISGVVFSWNPLSMSPGPGTPLAGAIVRARRSDGGPGFEMVTRTDDQGRFVFFGLPIVPDSTFGFYVSAEAPGHVPVYYPHAFAWTSAQPVRPMPDGSTSASPVPLPAPIIISLPQQTSNGSFFAVGYLRTTLGGVPVPIGGGGGTGGGTGGGGTGGGDSTSVGGTGALSLAAMLSPADSAADLWPVPGAFLYLVPAETATDGPIVPVAGGVSCQNGTLVVSDVAAGRYKAYADRPGFKLEWFHGTNYLEAAVITIGEGIDPVVIDIVLDPVLGPPPPGGERQGLDAKPRIVTGLRNAPNPFRPQTTIIYRLMADADVTLEIYDVGGRLVRRMFERLHQSAGEQHVPWDGNSDGGSRAGAGIYFYRISTATEKTTGKMVMLR